MQNSQNLNIFPDSLAGALQTSDIDELTAAQPGRNRRYLQLGKGALSAELSHVKLPAVQLYRERLNVGLHIEAAPSDLRVSFSIPLFVGDGVRFCNGEVTPRALVRATGGEWDIRVDSGIDFISCVFDRNYFEKRGFDVRGRPVDPTWLEIGMSRGCPDALFRFEACVHRVLHNSARKMDATAPEIERQITAQLLELAIVALASSAEDSRLDAAFCRRRAVKRAVEYLQDRPDSLCTIPELCEVAGVSQRTLEYGFRDLLGVTPVRYARLLRLNSVRQALLKSTDPNETVTKVALRYGFTELGRFAVEYRQLFGERPSETLSAR